MLPDPRTTRFNICHVVNSPYASIFDGIIVQLRGALTDLGYECTVKVNEAVVGAVNIVIGPLVFMWQYRGHMVPSLLERRYVLYQTEPLHERHPVFRKLEQRFAETFTQAAAIWEYAPGNLAFFRNSPWADRVHYLPPAFHHSLESFKPRPDPQIDVLFYGQPAPRRTVVLDKLVERGVKVIFIYGAYNEELNAEISNAKIVLNLHSFDDVNMLETVRISHLLANRCFVVSEASDHNPYGGGVVYADHADLADTCIAYLGPRAHERAAIADDGYAAVRRCDMAANLREVIARLPLAELTAA
jgi:hypothetical protein